MAVAPVLGDWTIPRVALLHTQEARRFAELPIPGRQGNVLQDLNAEPARIRIGGSLFAEEERSEFLTEVRTKFRSGEPLTFVADITEATDLQFVVIETMQFEQRAERPDEIAYHLVLRESPPPPPPPDPLGGIDAGLLDAAAGFVDGVSSALDAIDALANLPELSNPADKLGGVLEGVRGAVQGIGDVGARLGELFGN